jgi:serine/threonine-protein kinase
MAGDGSSKRPSTPLVAWWKRLTGAGDVDAPREEAPQAAVAPAASVISDDARFQERGLVAEGGMARIDRLFDSRLQRDVAVKRMTEASEHDRQRFVEEAQITGQLEHPNIVPIHDLSDSAERQALVMKLIAGESLHERLSRRPEAEAPSDRELEELLQIFLKVCDAIAFAHSRGVIHRDLKPHNVMVGSFGQVYLMDWGLAKLMDGSAAEGEAERITLTGPTREEQRGQVYGTPAYMAIEQAFGDVESIDERTDVYGLGGLLYEILTHKPPHTDLASVIRGQPVHPQEAVGDHPLPARLCEIAMKALSADQDDRQQTVLELKSEVEEFVRSGGWFATRHFAKGEDIVREGERGDCGYIIESGECEVWRGVGGRHERVLVLKAGEPFGEAALFSDLPRTATVTALTDVKLLVIDRPNLERELDRHTWLRSLVRAMARRFVDVDRELKRQRSSHPGSLDEP